MLHMYIELHSRSAFSFLEGASTPEELAEACHVHQMPAMALLDRDGVYGAARFHLAMKKLGLQPHIGAEITSLLPCVPLSDNVIRPRIPLLCASREGYQNLCRLITRTKLRAPKYPATLPRQAKKAPTQELLTTSQAIASTHDLAEFSSGLICITGGDEGPLAHALAHGGMPKARHTLERLMEIYGCNNVYVELQRHYNRAQEFRNQAAIELTRSLKLPLLATQGAQYAKPEDREILDVFTCIRHHRHLDTAGQLLASNSERYVKAPQQMLRLFADLPEAVANTLELSSRLDFTLNDLGYKFPAYPAPHGETMSSFLRERTYEGARERYQRLGQGELWQRARRQIDRELMLIERLKLEGYFLIVWDIVRYCREHDILVQGRGSAANSAVCYSLGITAVDPIRMELLFERFLSEERGEWPDIDLDLPSGDQREQAIQYVYERYGKLGAAMTANVITYRGRSAAREVGKVLGFDEDTLARLASLVSSWEYKDPGDTLERQFRDAGFELQQPRIRKFFELCVAVQDLPRHLGQHSGGMVICQGQLDSVVPLEPATMPGRVVVQWDKEDCADMGIIKVDLLGLGMMAAIKDSLTLIHDHYKEDVDLAQLPPDDPVVYRTLQKADTVGMFQIESRAQMSCLPRLYPTRFYDIVVQVAIIRPGPIVGKMVNPFLMRRQGREPVSYPHPSLEPVLERTLGVPLFQEQLLRMAMIAAGFSGGEAEELRRAMGFKRSEKRMRDIEIKLREGMKRNGISREAQEEIILSITSFALYGFPESHAASFALIAYASAYLKCHYLAAFTAALLNNQPMGFYSPATLVKDAQRHGLRVKPVDINCSDWPCTLEAETDNRLALRMGFRYAKGLSEEAATAIVHARTQRPFESIADLAHRVPELRRNDLVLLASIGALNSIGCATAKEAQTQLDHRQKNQRLHRRDALWQVERAVRFSGPLLDGISEVDAASPLAAMTPEERLVADFHGTGLTTGPHPMAYRRTELKRARILSAHELTQVPNGRRVRTAGCVIARQRPGTAKGFVFLSLEDETGIGNAIITPDIMDQHRVVITSEKFLLLEGVLQNQDGVLSVRVERVAPLRNLYSPEQTDITDAEVRSHDFH
jgi:error-prone DNA polymerase